MGSKENPPDGRRDHDADEREAAWAEGLRARYDRVVEKPLPDRLEELLEQLDDAEQQYR